MNKNIEIINDDLWAVNFDFVNMDLIDEISFKGEKKTNYACPTDDGKILINKNHSIYTKHLPLFKEIMKLSDDLLQEGGFYTVMRNVIHSLKKYTDEEIDYIIQKYKLENYEIVYHTWCDLEKERRIIKKQWDKKNEKPSKLINFFKKKVKP